MNRRLVLLPSLSPTNNSLPISFLSPSFLDLIWSHPHHHSPSSSYTILSCTLTDLNLWFSGTLTLDSFQNACPSSVNFDSFLMSFQSRLGLDSVNPPIPNSLIQFRVVCHPTTSRPIIQFYDSPDSPETIFSLDLHPLSEADPLPRIRDLLCHCANFMSSIFTSPSSTIPSSASTCDTSSIQVPKQLHSHPSTPSSIKICKDPVKDAERQIREQVKERDKAEKQRQRDEAKQRAKEEKDKLREEARQRAKEEKVKQKEETKQRIREEKERQRLDREKKLTPGSIQIMDQFIKRSKPSAPPTPSLNPPLSNMDTIFADYNPRKSMLVFPTVAWPVSRNSNSTTVFPPDKSIIEVLRNMSQESRRAPVPEYVPPFIMSTLFDGNIRDSNNDIMNTTCAQFKLIQFTEDRRPAYWGTWLKSLHGVGPRRPFAKDVSGCLDYNYDSEDEWEEEEDGEEIKSEEDDDDDDEGFIDYDDDDDDPANDWLVDDSVVPTSTSSTPAIHANSVNSRRVVRCLDPVIIGPFFGPLTDPFHCPHPALDGTAIIFFGDNSAPLDPLAGLEMMSNSTPIDKQGSDTNLLPRRAVMGAFPEDHIITFIRVVHGNMNGVQKIIEELKSRPEFANTAKAQLEAKLKQITVKEKRLTGKPCFYILDSILCQNRLSPTTLEIEDDDQEDISDISDIEIISMDRPHLPSVKRYLYPLKRSISPTISGNLQSSPAKRLCTETLSTSVSQ